MPFKVLPTNEMIHYRMNSCDGVEISSDNLVGRMQSAKLASMADHNHNDHEVTAQSDDEESASSFVCNSKIAQCRSSFVPAADREAKPIRRNVFDDMHDYFHFGNQLVDPKVRINSSLAPSGNDKMWFGDLDFDADAAALGFCLKESDPTLNDQRAPLELMDQPKEECVQVQEPQGEGH